MRTCGGRHARADGAVEKVREPRLPVFTPGKKQNEVIVCETLVRAVLHDDRHRWCGRRAAGGGVRVEEERRRCGCTSGGLRGSVAGEVVESGGKQCVERELARQIDDENRARDVVAREITSIRVRYRVFASVPFRECCRIVARKERKALAAMGRDKILVREA
jgi:hypothetical protein